MAAKLSDKAKATRKAIVNEGLWGNKNEPRIHYTQDSRRDDWLQNKWVRHLDMWLDCSSWGTYCCWRGGAEDPSGYNYHAVGNSDSILLHAYQHGLVIPLSEARAGDLVVFGGSATDHTGAHHVSLLMQTPGKFIHKNPNMHRILGDAHVSSHGSEGGPVKMDLKSEIAWEPNYHIIKTVPDDY